VRAGSTATALGVLLATAGVAAAMSVRPLDLTELASGAGTIFVGRVVRVDGGRDERGIPATWTTFTVDDTLKGAAGRELTIKEYAGAVDHGALGSVPRYAAGESVVLFLHPASALGFASPVGLGQGCFRIREHDGRRVVVSDAGRPDLGAARAAAPADATRRSGAPLPLEAFLARVRALVAATP
jgi:hypothetical protein